MKKENKKGIVLVDDHVLLRHALASVINAFENCRIVFEADNGKDLIDKIGNYAIPDIVLLDMSMPRMDGYETAVWLRDNHRQVHVLMLTMFDTELTLIRLLQAGVKGFLKKDVDARELKYALESVVQVGYYYSTQTAGKLVNLFKNNSKDNPIIKNNTLTDQEYTFLKLACSDLTYKEIAERMNLTPRTIDVLRDGLFIKLNVKSRVGLAMVAVHNGLAS